MLQNTQKAQIITLACIYLHNYLRNSKTPSWLYCPHCTFDYENSVTHDIIQGTWRGDDSPIANLYPLTQVGRRLGVDAKETSEEFAEYFKTEIGMLSWQDSVAWTNYSYCYFCINDINIVKVCCSVFLL